ncbi:MAG: D-aminoacyl-tRNA deacylase [Bryobacteraceae bacterium]|nr:D-aminoacyl-tRNA deacylase [Bryobacteraceae bacterium]
MRAVVQRVSRASVTVDGEVTGKIANGLLVLLGVGRDDSETDAEYLAEKIVAMRVFPDAAGKMNLSLADCGGGLLVVPQFTLLGDCGKGRRPNFGQAAPPEQARRLYERFVEASRAKGTHVETGVFQAHMDVELCNDGPVTLLIDSPR